MKTIFNMNQIVSFTICPQSKKTQSAMASMHILHNSVSLATESPSSCAKKQIGIFGLI